MSDIKGNYVYSKNMESMNIFHHDPNTNIIKGIYNENININNLNSIVLDVLKHNRSKQEYNLRQTLKKAGLLLNNEHTTWEDGVKLLGNTASILFKNNIFSEYEYEVETKDIVEYINKSKDKEKLHYIDIYMKILNKYVGVSIILYQHMNPGVCSTCNTIYDDSSNERMVCKNCGIVKNKYIKSLGNMDTGKSVV